MRPTCGIPIASSAATRSGTCPLGPTRRPQRSYPPWCRFSPPAGATEVSEIEDRLAEIRSQGLYRRMRVVSGPQGPRVLLDGKPVLLLCSNNYLGLADHPRVREAAAEAAMR